MGPEPLLSCHEPAGGDILSPLFVLARTIRFPREPMSQYRVTIRHHRETILYEVMEMEAENLLEAVTRAAERFPEELVETADLVEVRLANPAES